MQVVHDPEALDEFRHMTGRAPAFVPTMGALHEGHLALVRRAATFGAPVVVSIFVNPTQFGPGEDLDRYPRTLGADAAAADDAGCDVVFAPDADTIYPPGRDVPVPPLPAVATRPGLEDALRPGHFAGVCQVVARLFDLVRPATALFGEKDYQQLLVIRDLVAQQHAPDAARWPGLEIVTHPTVREPDGLAMSSRNAYLAAPRREQALGLARALAVAERGADPPEAEARMREVLADHHLEIDYAVARDAGTLMPIDTYARPARALVAARTGGIRLIDNAPLAARA